MFATNSTASLSQWALGHSIGTYEVGFVFTQLEGTPLLHQLSLSKRKELRNIIALGLPDRSHARAQKRFSDIRIRHPIETEFLI